MSKFLATSLKQVSYMAAKAKEEAEKKRAQKLKEKQRLARQAANKIVQEERRRAIEAENERLQIIEERKTVRAIYHSLAAAAWQGRNFAECSESHLLYADGLKPYGIKIVDQLFVIRFLNGAQQSLVNELHGLAGIYPSGKFPLNGEVERLSTGLKKSGIAWYLQNQENILSEIDAVEEDIYRRRGEEVNQVESMIAKAKQDNLGHVRAMKAQIARHEAELEKCLGFVKHLESIAKHLSGFTAKIASDLALRFPNAADVSLHNKVSFLRGAYSGIIPQHDFSRYSDLEILNIVRLACGLDAFCTTEEAEKQVSVGGDGASLRIPTLRTKLAVLSDALFAAASTPQSHLQNPMSAQLLAAKQEFLRLGECRNEYRKHAERIRNLYAEALRRFDSFSPRGLVYRRGCYENVVIAELDPSPNNLNPDVVIAYEELDWLSGRSGRMYLLKIERLLRSVAESASTSVEVTVRAKGGSKSTVELLGELFSANIRPALVLLMFKLAGLKISSAFHDNDEVVVVYSW